MLSGSAPRRSRGLRRSPAPVRRLAAVSAARERVRAAIERCAGRERAVLALMLFERLTPAEAAGALGVPVHELTRTYDTLMRELRRTLNGLRSRPPRTRAGRGRSTSDARVREA